MPLKLHSILPVANYKYTRPSILPVKSAICTSREIFRLSNISMPACSSTPILHAVILLMFTLLFLVATPLYATGLKLVASVAPQEYLLNQLKTPDSEVIVVIRPGQNPTTWDPTPHQMLEIVSADIMFPIGVPFENVWLPRLRQRAPNLIFVDTITGITRLKFNDKANTAAPHPEDPDHSSQSNHNPGHSHGDIDPHLWLDPLHCITMAVNMAGALQQFDPSNKNFYAERLEQLILHLERLHHDIERILAPLEHRTFLVFHPSWGYFAARYNLRQVALEKEGKEPSGAHLAELIEEARHKQIQVIFVQQQFSTRAAQAIANQTGARLETLNPLASDLPATLRHTAERLSLSMTP